MPSLTILRRAALSISLFGHFHSPFCLVIIVPGIQEFVNNFDVAKSTAYLSMLYQTHSFLT